uniref:von Hippel-Lindau disease tumour suppressor beta domain-containing protein n=1 Tax=Timema poppense TaxID=170557 RepID=A0A7R9DEF2_TIMPO|nr:unnamed protein product [Timema poppensis]
MTELLPVYMAPFVCTGRIQVDPAAMLRWAVTGPDISRLLNEFNGISPGSTESFQKQFVEIVHQPQHPIMELGNPLNKQSCNLIVINRCIVAEAKCVEALGSAVTWCKATSDFMAHNTHTPPKICSHNCDQRSYLRFCNTTERSVKVFWVNYEGKYVLYRVLPPSTHFDTDSFVTHPWVFIDAVTQERLVVNQEEVFYPQPMIVRSDNRTYRNCIFITLPLYSLKEIALQVIRNNIVRREGVYRLVRIEDVYRLEIPVVLQKELIAAIHRSTAVLATTEI